MPNPDEVDPGKRVQAAVKLTSWNDFRLIFGGFLPYSYLAYAVRGFFATGGQTCYVVRIGVAATPPTTAAIPLPAAISSNQITSIATANTAGATQIQLDSAEVLGIAQGSLIAIGDPVTGECVSVASVVDDQTITVQPPLLSVHAKGDPVYSILGSALTAAAVVGATSLQVGNAGAFVPGDLVSIEGGGVSEVRAVVAPPPGSASQGSTIQLGRGLGFAYGARTVVRKYTAALTVGAMSPGAWGNRIKLAITPLSPGNAVTHFSMLVTVDQGADPAQPPQQEFYPLLSLDPYDPYPLLSADSDGPSPAPGSSPPTSPIYVLNAVNNASELIQINPLPLPQIIATGTQLLVSGPIQTSDLYLEGGSDGTAGTAASVVTTPSANPCWAQASTAPPVTPPQPYPSPPNASVQDFQDALDVLGLVDEIAILCCPEAAGPPPQTPVTNAWSMMAIQQAMVEQCVRLHYRVAVLDTPEFGPSGAPLQPAEALSWLNQQGYSDPTARFAAVYYPWLQVPDELGIEGPNRTVPPSGHVAGAYAYTDNQFGVQKPPANVELQFVSDVQSDVTNQQQGFLNPAGINAIRSFGGRGIRVWGARSLAGLQNPDWKFIHTRRLLSMIEDSVEQASRWVVFRTNDDDLRRMLTHSLNVFLQSIWLTGGLQGARPTEGYFVKCDSTNNTQTSIDAGQLICQVGVAIAAPMEFLVFEMRRSVAGAQVVEA